MLDCAGETRDALRCSDDLDATWYWSRVGELVFRPVTDGGGGGSCMGSPYPLLPGRLSYDALVLS